MTQRNNTIDGIKYFLICLVILGHMIEPTKCTNLVMGSLHTWIYAFHMPLFIILTGYFSKQTNKEKLKKQLYLFLECYIVWSIIINIPFGSIRNFYSPVHSLWFLLSLMYWKSITYGFERVLSFLTIQENKAKYIILAFSIITCFAAFFYIEKRSHLLAVQRSCQFYPFFVIGYMLQPNTLNEIIRGNKFMATIILAVCSVIVVYYQGYPMMALFYHYSGAENIASLWGISKIATLALLLASYLLALAMSFAIITLVRLPLKIAEFGKYTLGIYLMQTLVFVGSQAYPSLFGPVPNSLLLAFFTIMVTTAIMKTRWSTLITAPISVILRNIYYKRQ